MKYQYPAIIQFIVEYLKGITYTVETDTHMFFLVAFYRKIIPGGTKSSPYIAPGHMMFESRRFAYDVRLHIQTI
jgi:hypothetical protein